jgi:hypothetical protein
VNSRFRKRLLRIGDDIAGQARAVFKACLGLTPHEQLALTLLLALILLGLTTRLAIRVLGLSF